MARPLSALLLVLAVTPSARGGEGGLVTAEEAARIARAWTLVIARNTGHWGGSPVPTLGSAHPLRDGERVVGFFFPVHPAGYVVVSARRELPPVKAYSSTSDLDPEAGGGIAAFLRQRLGNAIRRLEGLAGGAEAARAAAAETASSAHREAWKDLETIADAAARSPDAVAELLAAYQVAGGTVMVSSAWHQSEPYNLFCPSVTGSEACTNAAVGCVPLAAAQIMRYWAWPPFGVGFSFDDPYDWTAMPDELTGTATPAQIAAVAELCHEAGEAADVDYGCTGTSGYLTCGWAGCTSMEDAYRDTFRYADTMTTNDRDDDDSTAAWFDRLKGELNKRTPLLYAIPGHALVVDGWEEVGTPPQRFLHVNYGWGAGDNLGWYAVDNIPGGEPDEEYALIGIMPNTDVGRQISGLYPLEPTFPYRYLADDVRGSSATFAAGQYLQFLPAAKLTGDGAASAVVRIEGTSQAPSRLFAQGDTSRGIVLRGGAMTLAHGGTARLLPLGPPPFLRAAWLPELRAVSVSWEAGWGHAEGVEVARRVGTSGAWQQLRIVGAADRVFFDAAISPRTNYGYRVRSVAGGKASEWSTEVTVTTPDTL